jgi:hypothetical protein
MIKKQAFLYLLGILVGFFSIVSCIDPYKVTVQAEQSYLIVEGSITDLDEPQTISIFETNETATYKSSQFTSTISPKSTDITPVTKAKVSVIENGQKTYELFETQAGYYSTPINFIGTVGSSYKLVIEKSNGTRYESTEEKLSAVPEIGTLYDKFNAKGIKDNNAGSGVIATNDIYIDFTDPAEDRNFYRWKWTSYELQNICASCKQGYYVRTGNNATADGNCIQDIKLPGFNYYDYYCEAFCWDIFQGNQLDIFSDVYTNGQTQYDKVVAQIPLYQSNPCLVVVQQMSLSANAFRYLKLIEDQSENTGTLADTPPAPIKGNVSNIKNPNEIVLGYFSASSVSEIRYMMDRQNTIGGVKDGLFKYQNKREASPESETDERPVIPFAICKPSVSRTAIAPKNWQFGR